MSRSNIENFCTEKWTKRGQLNSGMYEYCSKLQVDGWNDAKSLVEQYQSEPWTADLSASSLGLFTTRGVTINV